MKVNHNHKRIDPALKAQEVCASHVRILLQMLTDPQPP